MTMILLWAVSDLYKSIFYIIDALPIQLIMGALLLLAADFAIIGQFYWYKDRKRLTDEVYPVASESD